MSVCANVRIGYVYVARDSIWLFHIFFLLLYFPISFAMLLRCSKLRTDTVSGRAHHFFVFCEGRRGEKTANVPHSSHNDEDDFCGVWRTKRQTDYIFRLIFFSPRFFLSLSEFASSVRVEVMQARARDGQKAFGGSNMHISRVIILHTFD